jgi:hypothetical protein
MMLKISVKQLHCVQFFPSNDVTPGILPLGETACIARILQSDWHNTYGRGGMISYQTREGISTEQICVAIKPSRSDQLMVTHFYHSNCLGAVDRSLVQTCALHGVFAGRPDISFAEVNL